MGRWKFGGARFGYVTCGMHGFREMNGLVT